MGTEQTQNMVRELLMHQKPINGLIGMKKPQNPSQKIGKIDLPSKIKAQVCINYPHIKPEIKA